MVDVVSAGDIEASELEQARERIAKHRAPAMSDMHRPGRIGRDVFDIDLLTRADRALPVGTALSQHRAQRVRPDRRLQSEIDETGTGDIGSGNQIVAPQAARDLFGKL